MLVLTDSKTRNGVVVLLTSFAAVVIGIVINRILQNRYRSPLRTIPGPFFASLTAQWLLFHDIAGHRATTIHRLHRHYGPTVRIGPNELSFSSAAAIRDIYGPQSVYTKSAAYEGFGKQGVFQMREREQHRRRQKRIAHVFAPGVLGEMEPLMRAEVRNLLAVVRKYQGKPFDVLHWFRMLALDIVGNLFLGKSFDALKNDEVPAYVHHLDNAYLVWAIRATFPLTYQLLLRLPFKSLQEFMAAGEYVYQYGTDAFNDYVARYGRTSTRRSLLTKLIAGDASGDTTPLSDEEICVEISNLVFAASDTTGNTLTYLFFELARNPQWQVRLREELRGIVFEEGVPRWGDVQGLRVLDAVVSEAMRLWPAAPTSLSRVAPKEGGNIAGLWVPGDTIVSAQAYTTQRIPSVFHLPDAFLPSRWLDATPEEETQMRDLLLAWGKGTRACLGRTMATMEMKITIAALVHGWQVRLAGPETVADMEVTDHFTIIPKGKRCRLVFEGVGE